jgi:molecular chaperone GrpE
MHSDDTPSASIDPPASDEALRRERDDLHDRLLRVTAEFDNYRKRTDRERRERGEAAGLDVIRELLPAIDDLERALQAPVDDVTAAGVRAGVELVHRQLLDLLKRRGVEPFDAVGQDFDPEWHEAVTNEPADGRRDGEVVGELRRGYKVGERLLRPAMVRVAKA